MAHKSMDSLRKAILAKAKKQLKEEVLPYTQDIMAKHIKKEVYDVYEPEVYDRRKDSTSLSSKENIKGVEEETPYGGLMFTIRNETMPRYQAGDYLTPLIVKGQEWALMNNYPIYYERLKNADYIASRGYKPYYYSRDFITPTKQEMDINEMTYLVKKGFKSR